MPSLFGDEFEIKLKEPVVKDLIKKSKIKKEVVVDPEKILKSKKTSLVDRLAVIKDNVLKVLSKQKDKVLVIKDKQTFENYITEAIKVGRIAIDTETNNSLDPITCKLMGPCFYYPGGKQAYIPINHRDPETKDRLDWQLTERDCREQFQRIVDSKIDIIMHNGKFDYEVIKCTCGIEVKPTWDTLVAARLLNENELAGLKWQYVNKIDKSQEKYDIEDLFENISYADVDPAVFALYAATDSMMTDKLYEVQKVELDKPEYGPHIDISGKHTVKGLRWLFYNVEMPLVIVTAEMELRGVKIDTVFGESLKIKYNNQLADIDTEITKELSILQPQIDAWKLSKEANEKTKTCVPAKTKMTAEKIEKMYPEIDSKGNRYKISKAKVEQLGDPINLASPTQLAILFYDILKAPAVSKKSPRGTGEEELEAINEKLNLPICKLLLKRRRIVKLITTYIDVIPDLAKHWPDGRIRFHLNALGTNTGRYSSGGKIKYMENDEPIEVSGINIQNIPSHNPEIRMLFTAATKQHEVIVSDNYYAVPETDEVETIAGWKKVQDLVVGDIIIGENTKDIIKNIAKQDRTYLLYV